jgi:porin
MTPSSHRKARFRVPIAAALTLGIAHLIAAQTTQPADADNEDTTTETTQAPTFDPWTAKSMTGEWGGVRTDLEDWGLKIELSYQQQYQQNLRGGLDTHNGQRQSGTYDLVFKLDFEKMGLIDNAGFYLKAKSSWGDGISDNKIGALNKVNSDIGGDHPIFVRKWWYWHKFADDKIELRLGNLQTNKDLFDVSLYANHEDKDFLNRSSIRNPTLPHRTGIGAFLKIQPVDWLYVQAAAVDAQSRDRRTGFDTAFHDEDWFIGIWEFGFTPKWKTPKGPLPGSYRFGWWYDPRVSTIYQDNLDGRLPDDQRGDDVGFYVGFDQMIFKENDNPDDTQGLGFFCRYGHAHRDINEISNYWSAGLSYKGLISGRDDDVLAFGVSQSILSSQYRHEINESADRETVYEAYYKLYVTPWLIITPDVQMITNPGGDKDDRDAFIAGVRLRVIF